MLTIKQAAKYIGLSNPRTTAYFQNGQIKAEKRQLKIGDKPQWVKPQWVTTKEALDDFLSKRKKGLTVDFEGYDLTPLEIKMLTLRKSRTLAEVGEVMGFSRQRAHEIQVKALGKIAAQKEIAS